MATERMRRQHLSPQARFLRHSAGGHGVPSRDSWVGSPVGGIVGDLTVVAKPPLDTSKQTSGLGVHSGSVAMRPVPVILPSLTGMQFPQGALQPWEGRGGET
jgi:hypothetical protein